MSEPISALSTETSAAIGPLSHTLGGGADAPHAALARICQMVIREAPLLACIDVFLFMASGTLCIIPLAFFLPKRCPKSGLALH